ncbi:MAG: hypothetical protein ACPGQL_03050 [Thermoplasmatota archaeon]
MKALLYATTLACALLLLPAAPTSAAPLEVKDCPAPPGMYGTGVYWQGFMLVCVPSPAKVDECRGFHGPGIGLYANGREVFCIH